MEPDSSSGSKMVNARTSQTRVNTFLEPPVKIVYCTAARTTTRATSPAVGVAGRAAHPEGSLAIAPAPHQGGMVSEGGAGGGPLAGPAPLGSYRVIPKLRCTPTGIL